MKQLEKIRILDGTVLKIIAMVCMVLDHVGDLFFPNLAVFRVLGRIAMPVFAFCIAEGYSHTSDQKKYLARLGIFALISEIPFDLAFFGKIGFEHQNIMLTFFLAVLALMLYDRVAKGTEMEEKPDYLMMLAGFGFVLLFAVIALLLRTDYTFFGVLTVFIFYVLRNHKWPFREVAGVLFLSITRTVGYYIFTVLSLIPILMYNGKRGKGLKWLFYLFYPGHLLVLYLIRRFLGIG